MAHQITEKDKVAYVGQVPWHGIGVQIADLMTASEAILHGGLGWKVLELPIFDAQGVKIEGYKGIYREDTKDLLHIAHQGYTTIQNERCFGVFDEIVGSGQAKYEVVGSLQGGRKIWLLARIPSLDFAIKGKDEVRAYLLLTTSHDGSLSLQVFETPIRVVCYNTLSSALAGREKGKVAYFKHTVNYSNRIGIAKGILEKSIAYFKQFKEVSEDLARKQMVQLEVDSFLDKLFSLEGQKKEEISTRVGNQREEMSRLFVDGLGNQQEGIRGTKWAMYNAVTEYVDHWRSTKGDDSNRLASSWYGSGSVLREKAFALLTK
jgi:phage/plasmid-like protein (TIGR03299 family)